MRAAFLRCRRAGIFLVGVGSVVGAVLLVWTLATREQIGALSNAHLAGMLALFLLPGATMAAWELDRRASLRRVEPEPEPESTTHAHGAARARRMSRHRRRVLHRARAAR